MSRRTLRLALLGSVSFSVFAAALLVACSDSTTSGNPDSGGVTPTGDGSTKADTSTEEDSAAGDASKDGGTDAPKDANPRDANGPGEAGTQCSFNHDCATGLRCYSDDVVFPPECRVGVRGTGRNGLDKCDSGEDCASSICVDGPPDSGTYCSDECASAADCVGALPQCTPVTFTGTICVRTPPK